LVWTINRKIWQNYPLFFILVFLIFRYYNTTNFTENKMAALQKLQEKIEQWKTDHEAIKAQNADLKSQLAGVAEAQKANESLLIEVEAKETQRKTLEETVSALQNELAEKDAEIEKIIAQVETLLA
jgi:predicted  nucleic acid-binding Zn-ribbon protein